MERKLTAILAADLVGYSRLMSEDEAGTLARLTALRETLLEPLVAGHGGRIVKLMGDGLLVEFPSAVNAVHCAVAWQDGVGDHDPDGQLKFRIGVHMGDVMIDGDDLYGDGVNIAARLEPLAAPGGIAVSGTVFEQLQGEMESRFEDRGEQSLKNIGRPVRVFQLTPEGAEAPATSAPGPTDKPSIVVLPFENMSRDPAQDYFSDGMTEEIITALGNSADLFVIDRHTALTYRGRSVAAKQVSAELGVRYVLEGGLRTAGERLRVTARLVDGESGEQLWSERFDRTLDDIFEVQDDITRNIAMALSATLLEGEYALTWQRGTTNFQAWQCVARAFPEFFKYTQQSMQECRRLGEQAIRLDPGYGAPHAIIGFTYLVDGRYFSKDPERDFAQAEAYASKALTFTDSQAQGHALMGQLLLRKRDYEGAIEESKKAITLAPNSAENHSLLGMAYVWAGRPEDAIAQTETAIRLSPRYPSYFLFTLTDANRQLGRLDQALDTAQRYAERNPDTYVAYVRLAALFAQAGRPDEAKAAARRVVALHPDFSVAAFGAEQPYKDPAVLEELLAGLRAAGLPD